MKPEFGWTNRRLSTCRHEPEMGGDEDGVAGRCRSGTGTMAVMDETSLARRSGRHCRGGAAHVVQSRFQIQSLSMHQIANDNRGGARHASTTVYQRPTTPCSAPIEECCAVGELGAHRGGGVALVPYRAAVVAEPGSHCLEEVGDVLGGVEHVRDLQRPQPVDVARRHPIAQVEEVGQDLPLPRLLEWYGACRRAGEQLEAEALYTWAAHPGTTFD